MKIRIVLVMLAMCASYIKVVAELSGPITTQIVGPGSIEYYTAFWYSESASYVNGGVTFTFPTNLFLQAPKVVVSVFDGTYSALSTVSPIITAISATSVTVRVNTGTLLNIGEAATDAFTVHIWAVGTAD
jgi:hypothetical protein